MATGFPSITVATSSTSGTGALVLGTADRADYRRTPKRAVAQGSLSDGDVVFYNVIDKSVTNGQPIFEVGWGTYDDTANTISRTASQVIDGSGGPGSLVSLPGTGVRDVLILSWIPYESSQVTQDRSLVIEADGDVIVNKGAGTGDFKVMTQTSGTTLHVDSGQGRVGINEASPTERLQLRDDSAAPVASLVTAGNVAPRFQGDADRTSSGLPVCQFQGYWNGSNVADVAALTGSDTTNKDEGRLRFRTSAPGGTMTEAMVIDENQHVGIGTSSPDGTLHVFVASAGSVAAAAAANDLVVENNGDCGISILTPNGSIGSLYFGEASASARGQFRYDHGNQRFDWVVEGNQGMMLDTSGLNITSAGALSSDEALTVDGAIGIKDGITAPTSKSGFAKIYVDSADGDLKVVFGDGTVKTIVVDT